jgi:nucleolar protein 58
LFKQFVCIFLPTKIYLFILFSIALLDDLDKEVNNYIMRCKEWYGWHFPELAKIIQDNVAFCKTVQKIGLLFVYSTGFYLYFYYE